MGRYVNEYLADEFKDPNHVKYIKMRWAIEKAETMECMVQPYERIEECSAEDLGPLLERTKNEKNERDRVVTEALKLVTEKSHEIERIRQRARELDLDSLLDEEYRDPISIYDFKYPVPEHLWPKINKTIEHGISGARAEEEFFTKIYANFPAAIEEDVDKHLNAAKTWDQFMHSVIEMKWSFDYGGWFDRNYWNDSQSAHKAGNSSKFPTNLCAYCSRDIDDDPKDYHVMTYAKDSPTRMRCDNCKGTAVLDRGTSREQCGDKHDEVDRMSRDIVNHIEHYYDLYKDTREKYLNYCINSRKRVISNEFRIASFGKEKIVVPRKKATKET